tara:strand:- start:4031 stop:4576 length:546 start_codon:yes stop_codon:yes gene_type:complete
LLKNSPFHFVDATFKMSVEKELSDNKSVNLSGAIHLVEDGWNDDLARGIACELQIRKYVMGFKSSESSLSGVYIAPFGNLSYYRMSETYYNWYYEYDEFGNYINWREETKVDASSKIIQAGILMGTQYIFSNVILLDLYLGGGIQYSIEKGNRNPVNHGGSGFRFYTGVIPKIGFNVGVKL